MDIVSPGQNSDQGLQLSLAASAMFIVIPIALVMYFFLLPARFEGERFAPGKVEKWIVIVALTLAMLVPLIFFAGAGGYRSSFDFWFAVVPGIFTIYALLIPVRMLLRIKIYPNEAWLIAVILLGIVIAIILPAFRGLPIQ